MNAYFAQGSYPMTIARSFLVNPQESKGVELVWGQWSVPESADNDDFFNLPPEKA